MLQLLDKLKIGCLCVFLLALLCMFVLYLMKVSNNNESQIVSE